MPAFHEMDIEAWAKNEERLNKLLCDPKVTEEIAHFEDWAADVEVAETFWGKGDGLVWIQDRRDPGSSWRIEQDHADAMIAHYELPVGLYEKLLSEARRTGLHRRLALRRAARKSVSALKASAEW